MKKGYKSFAVILSFIYILMVPFLSIFLYLRGMENLKSVYLINISADIFGIITGYVIYICCLFDVQKTGADNRGFLYLLNTIMLGLLTDAGAWLSDMVPDLRWFNILDNTIYYMITPIAGLLFFRYVLSFLQLGRIKASKMGFYRLIHILLFIDLLIIILNIPFGYFFTVDQNGVYERSAFTALSMIYPFFILSLTLILIWLERKQLQKYRIVILLLYVFIPLFVGILTIFVYGLSINYVILMMVMVLMYCIINIEQGRKKAVSDRDLDTAKGIQESMLPMIFPAFPEREDIDIFAMMRPAKEVGGDFYDFFFIDDIHLAMVMADVSGKGVPAALFMTISKVLLKNRLMDGDSPAEALKNVNSQVMENNPSKMFVTVWIGVLDTETGDGIAANAGHEHPIIRRKDGSYELIKYPHSPAVGMLKRSKFSEHEFHLEKGEGIFVYTDGVPEASDVSGELFGNERLIDSLNKNKDSAKSPEDEVKCLLSSLDIYTKGAPQSDDITMLSMAFKGIREIK